MQHEHRQAHTQQKIQTFVSVNDHLNNAFLGIATTQVQTIARFDQCYLNFPKKEKKTVQVLNQLTLTFCINIKLITVVTLAA